MTTDRDTADQFRTLLEQSPLGHHLGTTGSEVLAGYAGAERTLADGEFLFHRGDPPQPCCLVSRGRLGVVREETRHRSEVVVHVLKTGDLVGELSFIDGTDQTDSVRALGPAAVVPFALDSLDPLIEEHPRVGYDFLRAVIRRAHHIAASLRHQQEELADYVSRGGKRR